jgi:hypothetical protein
MPQLKIQLSKSLTLHLLPGSNGRIAEVNKLKVKDVTSSAMTHT